MPIYEYACESCDNIFEEWQTGYEERELPCPECGGKSKRLISNTSFVLKGTGWYTSDYGSGASRASAATDPATLGKKKNGNGDAKPAGDSAKAEAAPAAKAKEAAPAKAEAAAS